MVLCNHCSITFTGHTTCLQHVTHAGRTSLQLCHNPSKELMITSSTLLYSLYEMFHAFNSQRLSLGLGHRCLLSCHLVVMGYKKVSEMKQFFVYTGV